MQDASTTTTSVASSSSSPQEHNATVQSSGLTSPSRSSSLTSSMNKEDKKKHQRNMRYNAVDFLQHAGELLQIPQTTIATSIIFYHKFYQFIHEEQIAEDKYDKYQIACSCLFVACKCQESLRSLRDICNVLYKIRQPSKPHLSLKDQELFRLKQSITMHEQIVLRALAYNVRITVPYSYVGPYLKALNFAGPQGQDPTRDRQLSQLLQCTCNLLNDSLRTELHITHKSHEIAGGCIYLAARLCEIPLPYGGVNSQQQQQDDSGTTNTSREWYQLFNISKETIRSVSSEMILMYNDYKQGINK